MTDETSVSAILQQRAKAVAQAPAPAANKDGVQLTEFVMQQQLFAIATQYVFATTTALPITPIPMQPATLLGIINAFGRILPVIDLAELLQLNYDKNTTTNYLLLGEQQPELALAVSRVTGQLTVSEQILKNERNTESGLVDSMVRPGPDKAPRSLLSGRRILSDDRLFFSL